MSSLPRCQPQVLSVGKSSSHTITKLPAASITLVPGLGVQGDCHAGKAVQHQSLRQVNPGASNLRQVHLVPIEILRQVSTKLVGAQPLCPGDIGENVTTEGLDLASLPRGTELHFVGPEMTGDIAIVVLTGLRNPGPGMNKCRPGLKDIFVRVGKGSAGVMGIVKQGGVIKAGMQIVVVKPSGEESLQFV